MRMAIGHKTVTLSHDQTKFADIWFIKNKRHCSIPRFNHISVLTNNISTDIHTLALSQRIFIFGFPSKQDIKRS